MSTAERARFASPSGCLRGSFHSDLSGRCPWTAREAVRSATTSVLSALDESAPGFKEAGWRMSKPLARPLGLGAASNSPQPLPLPLPEAGRNHSDLRREQLRTWAARGIDNVGSRHQPPTVGQLRTRQPRSSPPPKTGGALDGPLICRAKKALQGSLCARYSGPPGSR